MLLENRPPTRTRTLAVRVPGRYTLRYGRGSAGMLAAAAALLLFLAAACALAAEDLTASAAILGGVFFGGCIALCLWEIRKVRRVSLTAADGRLSFRDRRGRVTECPFSDLAPAQLKKRALVLRRREGGTLCRLDYAMTGMHILLADLRTRGLLPPAGPAASPGTERLTLELPAQVPECYCLKVPALGKAVFWLCGAFCAGAVVLSAAAGQPAASFGFAVFLAGDLAVLLLCRQRVEVEGDVIRSRDLRGKRRRVSFSHIAAVRLQTLVTGAGTLSSFQLLGKDGTVLLAPDPMLSGIPFLLADLAGRGIPFTY